MGRLVGLGLALVLLLAGTVMVSTPAEAVPSCLGAGDVTLIGADGCTQGPLSFSGFAVSAAGVAAKILLGTFTTQIGQDVNLSFQIAHDPSPANLADILFLYSASTLDGAATLSGVDLFNPGKNVTIRETVCSTPFTNGVCSASNELADLVVPSQSTALASFLPQSTVYIRKDIQLLQDSFISEFTNSHDLTPTPEPATLLLVGSSLAALGMALRRRARHVEADTASDV